MSGMSMRPRYRSVTLEPALARAFTDRRDAFDLFRRTLNELSPEQQRVLNFYGVGGIGKSRLQRELQNLIRDELHGLTVRIDLQVPSLRRHDAAIYYIAHCLRADYKLRFPRFDIAYAAYWQRTNPQTPMTRKELPLLAESEVLSELVSAMTEIPGVGLVVSVVRLLDLLSRRGAKWQRVREDPDLQNLDRLDAHEVLDALTFLFARDLKESISGRTEPLAVFFDAHEALWEDIIVRATGDERDAWIRDLIVQTPGILYVVSGRDALTWHHANTEWQPPYLTRHAIGDLSRQDSLAFLESCGITGAAAEAIAVASMGVPFYLNVSVDHFFTLAGERHPHPEDFGSSHEDILGRFIGYLPRAEEELIKVLSVARYWDRDLFNHLVERFNVADPLARWPQLCAYSFNSETNAGRWVMHQLMRQELLRRLEADLESETEEALFALHRSRVEDAELPLRERALAFREAVYHGARARRLEAAWFQRGADLLMYRGLANALAETLDELDATHESIHDLSREERVLRELEVFYRGWIAQRQGRLTVAMGIFGTLDFALLSPLDLGIRFQIANAKRESGELVDAGRIYEELWNRRIKKGAKELHRLIGIQYADFHYVQGRFRDAATILATFTSLDETRCAKEIAEALRILGHVNRFNLTADRGLAHYRRAGVLFERLGDELGNALIQTNLAEALSTQDPEAALDYSDEAVRLNNELGARLEVGKAIAARAIAQLVLRRFDNAECDAEAAIAIQQEVGYRYGEAQAILVRAFIEAAQGRTVDATNSAATAAALFEKYQGYPTLRLLAAILAEHLGNDRLLACASRARAKTQWLEGDGEQRLRDLTRSLLLLSTGTPNAA